MSYTEYEEHQIKVINNVIENTKNSKEDSLSMMIDGKESNILYDTTEQALEKKLKKKEEPQRKRQDVKQKRTRA